jgi:hypothetical protein
MTYQIKYYFGLTVGIESCDYYQINTDEEGDDPDVEQRSMLIVSIPFLRFFFMF